MRFLIALALILVFGCEASSQTPEKNPKSKPRPEIRLMAFTADWCGACKQQHPILMQLVARHFNVQIIDYDRHPLLVAKHKITKVPTYLLFVNGREYRSHDIEEIVELLSKRWDG